MTEPAQQESYIPPKISPDLIMPPIGSQFANATWLAAGPEIREIVERLLEWEEFSDLTDLSYVVRWRRNGAPMLDAASGEPLFATVEITPARYVWEAIQREDTEFPRYIVDLRWPHFDALRRGKEHANEDDADEAPSGRGASYVHKDVLAQHIHHGLMGLAVTNDIVSRRPPTFRGYAETIHRFGQWSSGAVAVARQLELFAKDSPAARRAARQPHIAAAD